MNQPRPQDERFAPTPLVAVLGMSFLVSMGTGVFWNGLSFVAEERYDFNEARNFVLFAVMGGLYMLGALRAGVVTRYVRRRLSPRTVLAVVIVIQALMCLLPVAFDGEWALWTSAICVTLAASFSWPLSESYLTSGRHGAEMRSAIGWFNVTWTAAVCVPLLGMGAILKDHGEWVIGSLFFVNILGLIPLIWFARAPGHHDADESQAHQSDEYPMLLTSARFMLPLSYVLMSAMTPILPYRLGGIGVEVEYKALCTATWMVVRWFAVIIMWRMPIWHGRWGTLVLGGVTMTGGFGVVLVAPNLPIMFTGFVAYGIGMGVVYYASLYYGMAVGGAEIDAGGRHEAMIGLGYGGGPLVGLAVTVLGGGAPAIVGAVWGIMALGATPVIRPYFQARKRRKQQTNGGET